MTRRLVPQNQAFPFLPPGRVPMGQALQRPLSLGQTPQYRPGQELDPSWDNFTKVPALYPLAISLGGTSGSSNANSVQIRPEPFILHRITWATTGDAPPYLDIDTGYSLQGRAVTMAWSDEFTKFFGNSECLISAALGDSNGFLDIPNGALFQGKQSLTIKLTRIFWPAATDPANTDFYFQFAGVSLLPRGQNASGQAG